MKLLEQTLRLHQPNPQDPNWIQVVLTPLAAAVVLTMSCLTAAIYRNVIARNGATTFRLTILSLAGSDLALGLGLTLKFALSLRRDWLSQPAACLACLCFIFCPLYVSQAHLLLLSADRWVSIRRCTRSKASPLGSSCGGRSSPAALLALPWLYGLVVAGPVQLASFRHSLDQPVRCTFSRDHQPAYQIALVALFLASAVALLLTNWRLCRAAAAAGSRTHPAYPAAVLSSPAAAARGFLTANSARAIRHLALVVGAFTACQLPLMAYLCALIADPSRPQSSWLSLLYYPSYLSGCIAFAIHTVAAPEFRRELRRQWLALGELAGGRRRLMGRAWQRRRGQWRRRGQKRPGGVTAASVTEETTGV